MLHLSETSLTTRTMLHLQPTPNTIPPQPIKIEVTVLSAQGLKNPFSSSPCSCLSTLFFPKGLRLRPFTILSTAPPWNITNTVYTTTTDDQRGPNPIWEQNFNIPVDSTFFRNMAYSAIYLQVYAKSSSRGEKFLGWCQIPAGDIGWPPAPAGSVRFLSYRLRDKDGTRGEGVVNVAVKVASVIGEGISRLPVRDRANETCRTVIGVPVTVVPRSFVACEG